MAVSTSPYIELHCHSAFSFLDGVSLPQELARRAGELGHTTLALTDHNSVSGSMELAQIAADCGVRAIHGAEIDILTDSADGTESTPTRHLTLLVRDERGWSNLCRIITIAHQHTRDRAPRRERAEPSVDVQAVIDHAEGLVCLTGCAERSVIGRGANDQRTARRLLDAFGPEGMYVELQRP
jgi:error-prone DNA polymerase